MSNLHSQYGWTRRISIGNEGKENSYSSSERSKVLGSSEFGMRGIESRVDSVMREVNRKFEKLAADSFGPLDFARLGNRAERTPSEYNRSLSGSRKVRYSLTKKDFMNPIEGIDQYPQVSRTTYSNPPTYNSSPYNPSPSTYNPNQSTYNSSQSTYNPSPYNPSPYNPNQSSYNPSPSSYNPSPSLYNPSPRAPPQFATSLPLPTWREPFTSYNQNTQACPPSHAPAPSPSFTGGQNGYSGNWVPQNQGVSSQSPPQIYGDQSFFSPEQNFEKVTPQQYGQNFSSPQPVENFFSTGFEGGQNGHWGEHSFLGSKGIESEYGDMNSSMLSHDNQDVEGAPWWETRKRTYSRNARPERSSIKSSGRKKPKRSVNFNEMNETIPVSKYIGKEEFEVNEIQKPEPQVYYFSSPAEQPIQSMDYLQNLQYSQPYTHSVLQYL